MGSGQYDRNGPPELPHDPASPSLPVLCRRMRPSWRSLAPAAPHTRASTLIHAHAPLRPHGKRDAGAVLPVPQAEALPGPGLCPRTARVGLSSAPPSAAFPRPAWLPPAPILTRAPRCVCPGSWQPLSAAFPALSVTVLSYLPPCVSLFFSKMTHKMKRGILE